METEIKEFIDGFVHSQAMYGEITDIDRELGGIYNFVRDYVLRSGSPVYVLKCQKTIFLSKNNPVFDELYEVIKRFNTLLIEKGIMEIWDDKKNKLLNVIFPSINRHFIVKYSNEEDKVLKVNAIKKENL